MEFIDTNETKTRPTFGQRYDLIGDRMDAAYAARKQHAQGSAEYAAADAVVESVYADLRALNVEVKAARS